MGQRVVFDEQTLRDEIVKQWGPAGAHIEVYDMLLARIADLESQLDNAEYDLRDAWELI